MNSYSDTVPAVTTVFFFGDMAYSLFPGGSLAEPIGGATVSMFMLAQELSKDPVLDVCWVFSAAVNATLLSHPTIRLVQTEKPVKRGLPVVSRWINRSRLAAPYRVAGRSVLVASPRSAHSQSWNDALASGAKIVVRNVSDLCVDAGRGSSVYTDWIETTNLRDTSASQVSAVVLQTAAQKQMLESIGINFGTVIPGGWNHRTTPVTRSRNGTILWVGRCTALKRPWYFLELAAMMPDEQFVMVIPARGGQRELQKVMVRRAERIPNLKVITEQIHLSEVEELFDGAKVLVSTSEVEGFPVVFYQAGSAGVPIVSLSFDPDGIIARNDLGMVADGSLASLTACVSQMADIESEDSRRAASNAARYFREHHSVESTAESYKTLISSLWGDGR